MTNLLIKFFIKNKNDSSTPKVRKSYINLGTAVSVVCNLLLFGIKLFIGIISNSISAIADAFNNLSDIGSSLVTSIGYRLAEKPADKEHPFGHGRIEYMSALTVAILIILVGVELFKSSFNKILNPEDLSANTLTVVLLVISIIVKLWMFLFNRSIGKTISSAALIATASDSLNDSIATFSVLISVIVSIIFKINIDPYIGLAVAIFILYSGFTTIKETVNPLLGMPPEQETINGIVTLVKSYSEFVGIHDLIVHNYGPLRTFASLHVEVPSDTNIVVCHEAIDECEKRIKSELGIEAVIHMDPIDTNNETTVKTRQEVADAIIKIDPLLTLHDFRMVDGEKQINLIFDVVAPTNCKFTDEELKKNINTVCKELDFRYETVVTIDRDFISSL